MIRSLLAVTGCGLLLLLVASWFVRGDEAATVTPAAAGAATGSVEEARSEVIDLPAGIESPVTRDAVATAASGSAGATQPLPTQLWGRVVDASSKAAIAGADVELQHRDADEFDNLDWIYGGRIDSLARTRSDADGRFRFDVVRARPHRLRVQAVGYATAIVADRIGGSEVVIELGGGATVTGLIQSEGRPIADMDVRITLARERGDRIEIARARTDAGGAFRCDGLSAGNVWVQVNSPGFEDQNKGLYLEAGKVHHDTIELRPCQTLRGRVVDAVTGAPIAAAEVAESSAFHRAARTDADGRFQLGGLGEPPVGCYVRAPGYALVKLEVISECLILLRRGGEVAGCVVDGEGVPIGSAYVALVADLDATIGLHGCDWVPAPIGSDGRFRASGLRSDQHYWLLARAPGFGMRAQALGRRIGDAECFDIGNVVLRAPGGIEGQVVDDSGEPIVGAWLRIAALATDPGGGPTIGPPKRIAQLVAREAETDARGVFHCAGLAGGAYHVRASARWCRDGVATRVVVVDGRVREGVLLTLPSGKVIRGTLRRSDGTAFGAQARGLMLTAIAEDGSSDERAEVGPDGAFRFTRLVAPAYRIEMWPPPAGWWLEPVRGIVPGGPPLNLRLDPASFVAGRVVDPDGRPVSALVHAWIQEPGLPGLAQTWRTEADGAFRIEVPGTFQGAVRAYAEDGKGRRCGQSQEVLAGRSDVVIVLQPCP